MQINFQTQKAKMRQEKIKGQLKTVSLHTVSQKSLKCLLNHPIRLCPAALTTKTISSLRNLWRLIAAARDILILSKADIISLSEKKPEENYH